MASYVIAGASRGLGYAFVKELAKNPKNIIIGLVRNKEATEKQLQADGLLGKNVTIFKADMTDRPANEAAAEATMKLTGGELDYLIVNGAYISHEIQFMDMDELAKRPDLIESEFDTNFKVNVTGVVKTINAFVPLLRQGKTKKAIFISTGVADVDTINASGFNMTGPYAISKAAANLAIAMYSSTYSKEGLLFMSISPGVVDTGHALSFTPEQMEGASRMFAKFEEMKPGFKPLSPQESVQMCMDVAYKASVDNGDGGRFVSHHGNKDWL